MEKLSKKNSILYNQLWINKAIEDGNICFLPHNKPKNKSIGEYIEEKYNESKNNENIKITTKNSILYELEWRKKYLEENLTLPRIKSNKYSFGELLALKYFEKELLRPNTESILYLKNEHIKKLEKK